MRSLHWNSCFACCAFFLFGLFSARLPCHARSTDNEVTSPEVTTPAATTTPEQPKPDALEETLLMEMLRIIDHKFDSLSARMSVLERSVSNLNFYSVRQFRDVSQQFKITTAAVAEVSGQLGRVEADHRATKQSVTQVARDVSALRADSTKMFDDIANSIVYANQNIEEKFEEVKSGMEKVAQTTLAAVAESAKDPLQEDMAVVIKYLEDLPRNVSCDVDFRPLEERMEWRFAEIKQQTDMHFTDLINISAARVKDEEEREKKGERSAKEDESGEKGDGGRVLMALANMTHNVIDAVSYLRHTAGMIERLLASTDAIADEQSKLRRDVIKSRSLLTSEAVSEELLDGIDSLETKVVREDLQQSEAMEYTNDLDQTSSRGSPGTSSDSRLSGRFTSSGGRDRHELPRGPLWSSSACHLPPEFLQALDELAKNGSEVLGVLSNLAQHSSTSLTGTLTSLHDEVGRLEELRARLGKEFGLTSKTASAILGLGWSPQEMRHLHNTTKTIFNIVEAIASNTFWIPHIFRNMHHLERLTNRTIELSTRMLLEQKWSRSLDNELPRSGDTTRNFGAVREGMSQGEALDFIFDTNVKLRRVIPALTRLLAEPEPLLALVDGKHFTEGRVEVFYRGQWGSVCQEDMGHQEASAICRSLGYTGGISAGNAHFGKGRELQWRFNASCLTAFRCPLVTRPNKATDCGHDNDFSVICDHMLRMVSIPGVSDVNTGRLEWHHQGFWLPICARGWSGYEARVACKQMGYRDGREFDSSDMELHEGATNRTTWVTGVACTGSELRLDACRVESFLTENCPESGLPAGVRCQSHLP